MCCLFFLSTLQNSRKFVTLFQKCPYTESLTLFDVIRFVLTASLMGAIFSAAFAIYRARIQAIRYESYVTMIKVGDSELLTILADAPQSGNRVVQQFFIAKVTLTNRSNKDLEQYEFGLTLPHGLTAIEVDIIKPDRRHYAEMTKDTAMEKAVQPATMQEGHDAFAKAVERMDQPIEQEMDFVVKPFNRGESYAVNMTVVPMVIDGGYFRNDSHAILEENNLVPVAAVLGMNLRPRRFNMLRRRLNSWFG